MQVDGTCSDLVLMEYIADVSIFERKKRTVASLFIYSHSSYTAKAITFAVVSTTVLGCVARFIARKDYGLVGRPNSLAATVVMSLTDSRART